MSQDALYRLLPAIHRLRDAQIGEPLRGLLGILQEEADRIERQLDATYDNWFIETCDAWVVPYLGDLLGVRDIVTVEGTTASLRSYVANTLRFRQRKGTASVLEDLARSVTGWPAVAVEMFQQLAASAHLAHVVSGRLRTPDVRDTDALELIGGPFERAHHLADVRSIAERRGRHNLPNVALWVWRLESFAVADALPASVDPARFRFDPLGEDIALFGTDRTDSTADRTDESEVPGPLRRRPIHDELAAARTALAAGTPPLYRYLDPADPDRPFRIWEVDSAGQATEIPPARVRICDLSDWLTKVPAVESYIEPATGDTVETRVSVDPRLGRFIFLPVNVPPAGALVSYRHGFPGPIGGGLYERAAQLTALGDRQHFTIGAGGSHASLTAALAAWAGAAVRSDALFELLDNREHAVADLAIPDGTQVEIRGADEHRPVLRLTTPWRITLGDGAACTLDGMLIAGAGVELACAGTVTERRFTARHLTVPSIAAVAGSSGRLVLAMTRCVTGPVDLGVLGGEGSNLALTDTIVGDGGAGVSLIGGALDLNAVTVLGTVEATRLDASNTIFDDIVTVDETQRGCVRFSWVTPASRVPRRHRCQPGLALEPADPAEHESIVARLRPSFSSRRFGDAALLQLGPRCAREITRGADDGGEMGAWHFLQQGVREDNLAVVLDEYLRFGLEAGVFAVT